MRVLKLIIYFGLLTTFVVMTYAYFFPKASLQRTVFEPLNFDSHESKDPSFEKLDARYCVTYGDKEAPLKIVEFFSFQCPYCIRLFKEDFQHIQSALIDTGKISFQFHPVPQDLATVQAMVCFEKLDETEKKLFLEVIFEEAVPSDQELMTKLMITAMNVFKKPIPELSDHSFIQDHPLMEKIFQFLKQEKILAVPSLEANSRLFSQEIPSFQFINALQQG